MKIERIRPPLHKAKDLRCGDVFEATVLERGCVYMCADPETKRSDAILACVLVGANQPAGMLVWFPLEQDVVVHKDVVLRIREGGEAS